MQQQPPQILLNAHQVTALNQPMETYEFVIDESLSVTECIKIKSKFYQASQVVHCPGRDLVDLLFELNHVRIDPKVDNTLMITKLKEAFREVGVSVKTPHHKSMQTCYKPLGEISANIRFFVRPDHELVFLSSAVRPRLLINR